MRLNVNETEKYIRQLDGSYVLADRPDSRAPRQSSRSRLLRYTVKHWRLASTTSGFDSSGEREPFSFYYDGPFESRLICWLADESLQLSSIREEGRHHIGSKLQLTVSPIDEKEIEGNLKHWPANEYEPDERVYATLGVPRDRFSSIVSELHRPGAELEIGLNVRLYQSEIEDSLGDPWSTQYLSIEYGSSVPIEAYELCVGLGPGAPDEPLEDDDLDDLGELPIAANRPVKAEPRDARLSYVVWLLGALCLIALLN